MVYAQPESLQAVFQKNMPMTDKEWERVERNLGRLGQMAGLLKFVIGAGGALTMAIATAMFWVHKTAEAVANAQATITSIELDRRATLVQWHEWRRAKDEIDTKIVTLLDEFRKGLDRNEARLERLDRMDGRRD
jgi:hypothetical protein